MSITKKLIAVVLVVTMLPAFYISTYFFTGSALNPSRELRYSTAPESSAEAGRILSILAKKLDPNDLNQIRPALKGIVQVPVGGEDPLHNYLETLANVTSNMARIEAGLRDGRLSLASGNLKQANMSILELKSLTEETQALLRTAYLLLDRVASYYKIDASTQTKELDDLQQALTGYAEQVDELAASIPNQEGLGQTRLTLNASTPIIFVGELLSVYGSLRSQNGTYLGQRNITIAWGNMSSIALTNSAGNFSATVLFPAGYPAGSTSVIAVYLPSGEDSRVYASSRAPVSITVAYHISVITAVVFPYTVKPLDTLDVNGTLRTTNRTAIAGRLVTLMLDERPLTNATTDSSGSFHIRFQIPRLIPGGTHSLNVIFNATLDTYSPSNLTVHFLVELLKTTIQFAVEPSTVFSGTSITVAGNVTRLDGTPAGQGNVSIIIDGRRYNTTSGSAGNFGATVPTPLGLGFGNHTVQVTYNATDPAVASSASIASIYVYNSPVIILTAAALSAGTTSAVFFARRIRRRTVSRQAYAEPVLEQLRPAVEYSAANLAHTIEAERDDASKVRKSFRLAQSVINDKLSLPRNKNETHWEYYDRVTQLKPQVAQSLRRLTELFELAEYSPYPIDADQGKEATEHLLRVTKEIGAS